MLNEIKEYEEYTCDVKGLENPRLMCRIFSDKNHLTGIVRAMTIIARHELETRKYFDSEILDEQEQIIEDVKESIREWLGFDDGTGGLTSYDSWLERYYTELVIPYSELEKKKILSWSEIKSKKSKQFEVELMSDPIKFAKRNNNTLIMTTYERIVADAIYLGPLKRYYLVFKKVARNALFDRKEGAKRLEKYNNLLKLIGVYLVKRKYTGNKYNIVNMTDVANWTQCFSVYHEGKKYFDTFTYKKKFLVDSETVSKNIVKICINQDFLNDFHFEVIEENDFDQKDYDFEEFVYYSDIYGSEIMMFANTLYS